MAGAQMEKGLNNSCFLLIVIAGMERFAFKGVASNLVTYLTDIVEMSNSSAAKTVNSWCGFTSMLPLLVAPLADSYWDRFSTVLLSSFIYVLGLVALTSATLLSTWTTGNKTSNSFLFWSLCLISLGQGGYNPSLQAFGTDQLQNEEEQENSKRKSLFFQLWYFGICSGSLLGITLMSYIQDTFGWVLGYAIPTLSMVSSIALFLFGNRVFKYREDGKFIENIVRGIKGSASNVKKGGLTLSNERSDMIELELQEKPLCPQSLSNIKGKDEDPTKKLDAIKNARVMLRLFPMWAMLLMFAVIFQQPATFFTKQGMTMKRNIGRHFKIPPATLQSVITFSIILLMPLYDAVLIPITKLITRTEKGISVMQRIGIGMLLSIIAMVTSAVVEMKRLEISRNMGMHEVPLSIFWLLPQYILLGISDIFTVVGMQEYFYNEVPMRMRTMGFALYTSVFGVGSFFSAMLISIVETTTGSRGGKNWLSDDMREARIDNYYWILALLSTLSFIVYVIWCKYYNRNGFQQ